MLGFIEGIRGHPGLYFRDKYMGMVNITDEEAVEIYMTEVIDKDAYYRTGNPEIRKQYKNAILLAVLAEKNGLEIEYISDDTPSGDIICQGCYQFRLKVPDFPGCVRNRGIRLKKSISNS